MMIVNIMMIISAFIWWTSIGLAWIWGKYGDYGTSKIKSDDIRKLTFLDKIALGPVMWYLGVKYKK
jgi:hypothetical protein